MVGRRDAEVGVSGADARCVIVIPCFNEAKRLRQDEVLKLSRSLGVGVLLVDDGSTDQTLDILAALSSEPGIEHISLGRNVGKAEAVRVGLLAALDGNASIVGYIDADFAVPSTEVLRLLMQLRGQDGLNALLGSRVLLAGRRIERSRLRHYIGRTVATYLAASYGLPVYDTQCGAKFFRSSPVLRAVLTAPFVTRWLFDVELLVRLQRAEGGVLAGLLREEPLEQWTHVGESKVAGTEVRRVLSDFWALRRHLPTLPVVPLPSVHEARPAPYVMAERDGGRPSALEEAA